jgi:fatty-acid peroxygenase
MQATTPRGRVPDSTLALWRDGCLFMTNRRRRHQSEIFETRLLGRRTICLHGLHAAQLLYDSRRFKRAGALPGRVLKTAMGRTGVQMLDGEAHHARKQMFMTLMTPTNIDALVRTIQTHWQHVLTEWHLKKEVVLFEEVQRLLCHAVCDWAGVPLSDDEVSRRAKDLGAMIDGFGGLRPRYWRGRRARNRSEGWIARVVDEVRVGG